LKREKRFERKFADIDREGGKSYKNNSFERKEEQRMKQEKR
jgi:hypothetical protein